MKNAPITTHVLNTSLGKPAAGIYLELWVLKDIKWSLLSSAITNEDGRIDGWKETSWFENKPADEILGAYKIVFSLESYWQAQALEAFYPSIEICFNVQDTKHHHIPLLLSPYSYSTYRGS